MICDKCKNEIGTKGEFCKFCGEKKLATPAIGNKNYLAYILIIFGCGILAIFSSASSLSFLVGYIIGIVFISIIPMLIVTYCIWRFVFKRRKSFILMLSVVFLCTTIIQGFLKVFIDYEMQKMIHDDSETIDDVVEFYDDGFYIDFPNEVETANASVDGLDINVYASTDGYSNYYVKIGHFDNNLTNLLATNDQAVDHFLEKIVYDIASQIGTDGEVIASERMQFDEKFEGVNYKSAFNLDGERYYSTGVFFVREDGSTIQVSVNYPSLMDDEMQDKPKKFIESLVVK